MGLLIGKTLTVWQRLACH